MPETGNLDDVSVVDGKLIREVPSVKLDGIIARGTVRMARLTGRIAELVTERNRCQIAINRATTLKEELETVIK